MTDKEFRQTLFICTPMGVCFLLFPAFCLITILFGYVWAGFIVMECVIGAIIVPCFVARTLFLARHSQYATKKRLLFETIAYIAALRLPSARRFW